MQSIASFDEINNWIANQFSGFFSKEFVFKVIDELFQQGVILEIGKLSYKIND